jgi:ribosomal protein S18 acetylase RimI-like enzyme
VSRKKPGVQIRHASEADISALFELFERERELTDYAAQALESKDLICWVAQEDGEIVGAILTHLMKTPEGDRLGGVDELLVAGSRRGRSIGRTLMDAAEAHYRAAGAAGMQLTVSDGNEPAQKLYASMGYESIQRRMRMRKTF